ncbi:kinetochore complex Sim4 subunit Fta1-domain-containing protein [Xylaria palmicola]|nr:kinetochore complex Sim4 subunit Fta1-domain-containing protein [Xylaria palmicola]
MPPKRRGRPAAARAPPGHPAAADDAASDHTDGDQDQSRDSDSSRESDPERDRADATAPGFKFFNTTFSTFRVSPLYVARNPLTPAGLETLSRRLRDTLVGDVVRGVQVGLDGDVALGRLGALERVEWRACSLGAIFPSLADAETSADRGRGKADRARGNPHRRDGQRRRGSRDKRAASLLSLELEYERATYSALLLPSLDDREEEDGLGREADDDNGLQPHENPTWTRNSTTPTNSRSAKDRRRGDEDEDQRAAFASFPLLLTRMPAPLKTVLVDFLSGTFDCRISPLHLGTRTLIRSWERWIGESGRGGGGGGDALSRDVALTLGFHLEPPATTHAAKDGHGTPDEQQQHDLKNTTALGLRTMDIVVPAEEIGRFLRAGRAPAGAGAADPDPIITKGGMARKRPAEEDPIEAERERLRRRKLGGGRDEEGWGWLLQHHHQRAAPPQSDDDDGGGDGGGNRETEDDDAPFTDALARYLARHLALDVFHPGVRVLRVVCAPFVLSGGGGGRVKVFAPASPASEAFVRDLVRAARGPAWGDGALRLAGLRALGKG